MMGIARVLLSKLFIEADNNNALAQEISERFKSKIFGIKIPDEKKEGGGVLTMAQRLKKARLQRPDYIKILQNQDYLLGALDKASKTDKEHQDLVKK
jgi:hypothetical protein